MYRLDHNKKCFPKNIKELNKILKIKITILKLIVLEI